MKEKLNQEELSHLRWMLQKENMKQDIFLIGRPGISRRNLAMAFLELTCKEYEYVSLSRDTTEADLKQRREIINSSAKYIDQVNTSESVYPTGFNVLHVLCKQ